MLLSIFLVVNPAHCYDCDYCVTSKAFAPAAMSDGACTASGCWCTWQFFGGACDQTCCNSNYTVIPCSSLQQSDTPWCLVLYVTTVNTVEKQCSPFCAQVGCYPQTQCGGWADLWGNSIGCAFNDGPHLFYPNECVTTQ